MVLHAAVISIVGFCLFVLFRTDCMFSPDDRMVITGVSMDKGEDYGKAVFFERDTFNRVHEMPIEGAVSDRGVGDGYGVWNGSSTLGCFVCSCYHHVLFASLYLCQHTLEMLEQSLLSSQLWKYIDSACITLTQPCSIWYVHGVFVCACVCVCGSAYMFDFCFVYFLYMYILTHHVLCNAISF